MRATVAKRFSDLVSKKQKKKRKKIVMEKMFHANWNLGKETASFE